MNHKGATTTPQMTQNLLSHRLNSVGVQTFNFAFFPEGEAMINYNIFSPKAHFTRFTSHECWQTGSSIAMLAEFLELIHPDDSDVLTEYVNDHMSFSMSGEVSEVPEPFSTSRFRARENESEPYRWWELRSHLYLDSESGVVICEGCFLDITELRLREELLESQKVELESEIIERRKAQRRLEETLHDLKVAQEALLVKTKLEALGNLASGVAHDFQNLLMPIYFYNDEMMTKLKGLEEESTVSSTLFSELFACINRIETSVSDSVALINKLKSEYRPEEHTRLSKSAVRLSTLILDAWYLSLPHWKLSEVSPELDLSLPRDLVILTVESELRQAVTNVFINALYAIADRYTQEPLPEILSVQVELTREGDQCTLTIQDQAVGMSSEVLQRCQESFFSTKGDHGSGLGLYMVSKSIHELGGKLEISSQLGTGTAVRFIFNQDDISSTLELDEGVK